MRAMIGRRVRRALAAVSIGLTAVLLAGCSLGDDKPTVDAIGSQDEGRMPQATADSLDKALKSALEMSGATGAIAGVWAPWSGEWKAAEGAAAEPSDSKSKKSGPDMTTSMSWRIGSVTKPMTCTVLLKLVEAGKVKLDDKVTTYLPRLVGIGDYTLEQLCQNTSGIADYWSELYPQAVTNPQRTWDEVELINSALGTPVGKPGQRFGYSNAGFVLLGMALEAVTNQSMSELYAEYVEKPLGLTSTGVPSGTSLPSPAAHGYAADEDPITGHRDCTATVDVTALSPTFMQASGAVVSDLDDTASIAHAVAAGDLVNSGLAKQQQTAITISSKAPSWATYGLGVEKMGPLVGHASAVPGYLTAAYSDPATGLTVVVMLNDSTNGAAFVRTLALELASIASKAKASDGKKTPVVGLPWTATQMQQALPYLDVCGKSYGKTSSNSTVAAITRIGPAY